MRKLLNIIRLFIWLSLLTGLIYPLLITGVAQLFWRFQAGGSLLNVQGVMVGSHLLAQNFTGERYFWPRPSSQEFDPMRSGGSNLGPMSSELKRLVEERAKRLKRTPDDIPSELLFASGSGLDPHIGPAAAYYQLERILRARGLADDPLARIALRELIEESVEPRSFGFLGTTRINVLELNYKLDGRL